MTLFQATVPLMALAVASVGTLLLRQEAKLLDSQSRVKVASK